MKRLHSSARMLSAAAIAASLSGSPVNAAPAAGPTIVVPYNADDDGYDGQRDFESATLSAAEDDCPRLAPPTGEGPVESRVGGAPEGAVRVHATGHEVRVESLRPRGPDWDGRFRVELRRGAESVTHECHVAPLVVRSGLSPATTVLVRAFPGRNDRFVEQLGELCSAADAKLHVVPAGEPYAPHHIWLQDAVEFCSTAGAAPPLCVALSANRDQAIDLVARDRLLGPGIGYLQVGAYREEFAKGEGGCSWIDWYGNLEASPPTKDYPTGRIFYGVDAERGAQLHPDVVAFFAAQGVQAPLGLDVGWLTIKHVDEMVTFLPSKGADGKPDGDYWVVVPDPTLGVELLERLREQGDGAAPMLGLFEPDETIESILSDDAFVATNRRMWSERIEPMTRVLLEGIGLPPSRLKRLPVLFQATGLPRTPNVVNCLVLPMADGTAKVGMAAPDGPRIDGADAWEAEVLRLLADAAVEVSFLDDRQYHKWSGNVHCATNAIRSGE
ncbi:MAG: protein-arginine deiminase family protein [Lacipirellulaceae bacterium]